MSETNMDIKLNLNEKDIIWCPNKKPHMFICGESGSGKTELIDTILNELLEKDVKIILANPCEMFISNYNDNKKVFNVSRIDELVMKLKDVEFKIDLLNLVCSSYKVTDIPIDGKINIEGVTTIDGYPLSEEVLDIYHTTNLGEEEEISLDEFKFEDHIYEHIVIKDKNHERSKKLLITEDNYTVDGEFYFEPIFIIIDGITYYEYSLFHENQEPFMKEFERIFKKLLLVGRKYNIHVLMSSTLEHSKYKELTNIKVDLD